MKEVKIEVVTDDKFGESKSAIVNVYPEGEWILRDNFEFKNVEGYPLCLIELDDDHQLVMDDSLTFFYSDSGSLHAKCFAKLTANRYLLEYTSDRIIESINVIKIVKNHYSFGPHSVTPVYSYFASGGIKEDPSYHLFTCEVHDSINDFVVGTFADEYMPRREWVNVRGKNFGTVTILHQVDHVYLRR